MVIGILKEPSHDNRIAVIQESVKTLKALNTEIRIEKGAGEKAFISDDDFINAGAVITDRNNILTESDLVLCIHAIGKVEFSKMKKEAVLVSTLNPLGDQELVNQLLEAKITSFSLDNIPRTTRAQAMDILSSMATVAGYKAVLVAASHLPKFFPMFMTAAGSITPSKVLILGAGVAGLQAIATAKRLGGVVEAFDVRKAAGEEVKSLGAKFIEVEGATDDKTAGGYAVEQSEEFKQKQAQLIHDHALKSDVVICTAQIPGRKAPLLLKKETVAAMKPGSIIIDMASSSGGNCEVSKNNETTIYNGVTIIGDSNLAHSIPSDASKMFGKNMVNLLKLMIDKEGNLNLNWNDDIVKGTCVTHNGEIISDRIKNFYAQKVN